MNELLIDIVYDLLKDKNLYNYNNNEELKNVKISTYYDLENIKHIKIDLGYDFYVITIEKGLVINNER